MKLLIGADLVPTELNIDLFNKGDAETLVGSGLLAIRNCIECEVHRELMIKGLEKQ